MPPIHALTLLVIPSKGAFTPCLQQTAFFFSAPHRARLHTPALFASIVKIFSHINFTPFKVSFCSRGNFITPGLCTAKINKNLFVQLKRRSDTAPGIHDDSIMSYAIARSGASLVS